MVSLIVKSFFFDFQYLNIIPIKIIVMIDSYHSYRTQITLELLSKTPECITEKLDSHSFSGFSNYMKNYYIRNYNENCLIENCYICQK